MTFEEFVLQNFSKEDGISKTDWYNAQIAYLQDYESSKGIIDYYYIDDFSEMLMYWYEYEISFAPGESVKNKVEAPIYPTIETAYEPPVYEYTYLCSPAKLWNDFGTLEIVINTPFYMTKSSENGFEKTEEGYRLKQEGLPKGELEFTLSESENPKYDMDLLFYQLTWGFYLYGIPLLIIGGVILLIVKARKSEKNKE